MDHQNNAAVLVRGCVITLQSGQLWHAEHFMMSSCFLIYLLQSSEWEYLFQTCRYLKHGRFLLNV